MVLEKAYRERSRVFKLAAVRAASVPLLLTVLRGPKLCGGKSCESCSWTQQSVPGSCLSCRGLRGCKLVTKDGVLWWYWFRVVRTLVEPYWAILTFAISCVDVSLGGWLLLLEVPCLELREPAAMWGISICKLPLQINTLTCTAILSGPDEQWHCEFLCSSF